MWKSQSELSSGELPIVGNVLASTLIPHKIANVLNLNLNHHKNWQQRILDYCIIWHLDINNNSTHLSIRLIHTHRGISGKACEEHKKEEVSSRLNIAISHASLVTTFVLERLGKFQKATHVFNLYDSSSLRMLGLFDFRKSLSQGRCVRVWTHTTDHFFVAYHVQQNTFIKGK